MLQKLTVNAASQQKPKVTSHKDIALAEPGKWLVEGEQGLYLHVSPDGQVRRWLFRYTSPVTRKVTETGFGKTAHISLAQAKAKADAMRKQIANGVCPINARREGRRACITFKEAADAWIETHKPSWRGQSMLRNVNVLLHLHGTPLANKRVAEITPDTVQTALKDLWAKAPLQGRRTLTAWERVFDFAKAKGMRTGDNPCEWKSCHQYRWPKTRAIDRGHFTALPYQKLPSFMKQLRSRQNHGVGAVALEFLILTASRSGEVLNTQWCEIDFDQKIWTLLPHRTKQGRQHQVPLSDRAVELLLRQRQSSNSSPYIFTGYSGKEPLTQTSMRNIMRAMGFSETIHGFRSSFRDWAGDLTHFARNDIEECLGHAVGDATERAYRRSQALEKRREILEAWASHCEGHTAA
jgi:integrase